MWVRVSEDCSGFSTISVVRTLQIMREKVAKLRCIFVIAILKIRMLDPGDKDE